MYIKSNLHNIKGCGKSGKIGVQRILSMFLLGG